MSTDESICCGAAVTDDGFCTECGEHTLTLSNAPAYLQALDDVLALRPDYLPKAVAGSADYNQALLDWTTYIEALRHDDK